MNHLDQLPLSGPSQETKTLVTVSTLFKHMFPSLTVNQSDSYSAEELKKFREDPEYYWVYRKEIERYINLDHSCLFPDTLAAIGSKQRIIDNMKLKLAKKPEIFEAIQPGFRPGCRRLTPGPGFLEALVEDNVHFTTSPITSVTKDVSLKQR